MLSGHSTVDYVLGRDAQEAALSWAAEIDTKLDKSDAPRHVLDKDVQVLDPSSFQNLTSMSGKPASLPANQGFSRGGFGLVEVLDRMTGGWALGHRRQPKDDFVSSSTASPFSIRTRRRLRPPPISPPTSLRRSSLRTRSAKR